MNAPHRMTNDDFMATVVRALTALDEVSGVERIDNRTLGVEVGQDRFILDVEAVDETPHPIIGLLDGPGRRGEGA